MAHVPGMAKLISEFEALHARRRAERLIRTGTFMDAFARELDAMLRQRGQKETITCVITARRLSRLSHI